MKTGTIDNSPSLIDPYGRRIEYLRLSLTDKCNLRCFYCMPKGHSDFELPEHWLNDDEIVRVIRAFTELGVARVRLTGGEPLVRKGVPELARRLTALPGLDDLSLSTNAVLLAKQAQALKQAGISRINVSLDSLRPERFKQITGSDLQPVLDGLMAARDQGFAPIKINMVAMRGINDDEFEDMVEFCLQNNFTLRFIETMPMGNTGREASQQYIPLSEIHERLAKKYKLVKANMNGGGPARYVRVDGTELRIGYITPMSQHFCDTCNRVRLSHDGTLYLCLGQNDSYPLRDLMRSGISDEELKQHIQKAIDLKPEKHEFSENPKKLVRFMSMTGG